MNIEAYAILAAICVVVVGIYISVLVRRGKRRDEFFSSAGFSIPDNKKRQSIVEILKIKSKGAVSIPFGSKVYMASEAIGDFVVCDLVASVGFARYTGFSKITVLGFFGGMGADSSFLLRKAYPMETRMELREAISLENKWYAWCSGMRRDEIDEVAEGAQVFGPAAIIRKNGSAMSLYFVNKYLDEKEVEVIMTEWRMFCKSFL